MIPKLRFPEFHKSWHKVSISEISEICGGGTPDTTIPEYWGGEINWFTPTEIGKSKFVSASKRKISDKGLSKSSAKLLPEGTILLSTRATIGETSITTEKSTTNQGFQNLVVGDSYDIEFVYYLIGTLRKELLRRSSGSTFLEISKKEIAKIQCSIPAFEEQQKIGLYLSSIDQKINLLTKKKEALETYKKGLMQKIFSQELRFKREDGTDYPEWEKLTIRDIAEIIGGGTPDTNVPSFWNGEINWFTPTEVGKQKYLSKSKRTITNDGLVGSSAKLLPKGTVLLSTRATIGETSITRAESTTNQGFQNLAVSDSNDTEFVYYLISTMRKELLRRSSGSTFLEISKKEIAKIQCLIPALEEQQKIGFLLSSLDQKINLFDKKKEKVVKIKKGLLQQMFV